MAWQSYALHLYLAWQDENQIQTWWQNFSQLNLKYLGVLLDKHLHWNQQISQIEMKPNRAIGILSKLRHNGI